MGVSIVPALRALKPAVLTIAVSIGGNTAMFSVINGLFLQPLAIAAPQEIVRIYTGESTVSWPNIDDIRRRNTVLTDVVAQGQSAVSLAADPLPVRLSAGLVSPNYFIVLGAVPLAGRTLQPDERRADVVVLSERLWRTRFGSSAVVGSFVASGGSTVRRRGGGEDPWLCGPGFRRVCLCRGIQL